MLFRRDSSVCRLSRSCHTMSTLKVPNTLDEEVGIETTDSRSRAEDTADALFQLRAFRTLYILASLCEAIAGVQRLAVVMLPARSMELISLAEKPSGQRLLEDFELIRRRWKILAEPHRPKVHGHSLQARCVGR